MPPKGNITLSGTGVTWQDYPERPNCIQIISGDEKVVLQASNERDALEWASTLYHASAIANGGGYLIELERKKEASRRKSTAATLALDP